MSVAAVWQAGVFIARRDRGPLLPCLASSLKRVASVLLGLAYLAIFALLAFSLEPFRSIVGTRNSDNASARSFTSEWLVTIALARRRYQHMFCGREAGDQGSTMLGRCLAKVTADVAAVIVH